MEMLRQALFTFQEELGYPLPDQITYTRLKRFRVGESIMDLGKAGSYIVFGFNIGREDERFKVFKSKKEAKFFFTNLKQIDREFIGFMLKEIDALTNGEIL
ncbi:DUF3964 family protein (plasmid) [Pontibacillus sp. ALD_SL1]|uniref:DUF3964 family protein n=1 Tax=Pontibacillus sp. ALD_SL1 TaxID=2777185 RepID=UPI001A95EA1B|nr:DUF3964 family protein [Pontibacillus sp. ALD_SL1]QST02933.1 DUF3964 family protein [Pontibacillus sp. ALD_SL1]